MDRRILVLCFSITATGCNDSGLGGQNMNGGTDMTDSVAPPDLAESVDLTTEPAPDLSPTRSGIGDTCMGAGMMDQGTCKDGQWCIPDGQFGYTNGYCTADCLNMNCPGNDSVCLRFGGQFALCVLKCTSDKDCRTPDYACQMFGGVQGCLPVQMGGNGGGVTPGKGPNGTACVMPVQKPMGGGMWSPNVQVSPGRNGSTEAEGWLAVDPTNKNIVVAYNKLANGGGGIGVVKSTDDGVAWGNEAVLPLDRTIDKNREQSDPVVAVDTKGNFYVSWVGFNRDNMGNPTNMNIFVARSSNGGITLDAIAQVSPAGEGNAGGLDKPWVFASPLDNSVWVTWDRFTNGGTAIRLARSTDSGMTWSAPVNLNDAGKRGTADRNLAQPFITPDGKAYIAWLEIGAAQFGATTNAVYLQRFNADGTANGANVKVSTPPDSPTFMDPSVVAFGGNVYVSFISGTSKGDWDVRVAASLDGGATFKPSVKANDDPTCATHAWQQIAVDTKGNVHAIFYDNRYLDGNVFWTMAGPADANNPLMFAKNQFVNDVPFTFTTRRDMSNWLGDYLGLWIQGGEMYATWTDNRTTNRSHMFFAKAKAP